MNKSYKLLGSFWDKRDSKVIAMPLLVKDYDICYCEDYKVEYNLFDIDGGKRKIKFSELLKLKDFTAFEVATHLSHHENGAAPLRILGHRVRYKASLDKKAICCLSCL